ncbi:MAG: aminotransferase class IV, partial [Fimbriimonadaceae bacterium]|nr:aminotransferase class IV [Alphaproteobacteria bacterium]
MAAQSYDSLEGVIWYDGKLVPWADANVHVLTHGLHYASSVFEGQRAYNGKIFKLEEHTDRLINSGRILGFEIPYSADEINQANLQVLEAQKLTNAYLRPVAW